MISVTLNKSITTVPSIFKFPGGEQQVQLLSEALPHNIFEVVITVPRMQPEDIVTVALIKDALIRHSKSSIEHFELCIPYMPFARQDRVCNRGEALSIKVFANMLDSLEFDSIVTWDAHSDVAAACFDTPIRVVRKPELFSNEEFIKLLYKTTLVAPDAGAAKEVFNIARTHNVQFIQASKIRDTKTGEIVKTEVKAVCGEDYLIIDDICDGGRTFIELAKEMRKQGCGKLYLYVTHGIFSKGTEVLEPYFDKVFTTTSFYDGKSNDFIEVL